jgi:hypothetical protein
MKPMRTHSLVVSLLAGLALGGCSNSTPTATTLSYKDPTSSGWRLVKDPSSTASRLVLALVGPSGTTTRGVGFNLQAGAGVRWATFTGGLPIQDTGVFELKNSTPDPTLPATAEDPILLDGGVMDGNILTVGIFQKDRRYTAKDAGAPLLRIALEVSPGVLAGAVIPLALKKAKFLPGDIGAYTDDQLSILNKSRLDVIDIAVGTLQLH